MRNQLMIRLAKYGCANRPFYQVVVIRSHKKREAAPIEQVGSFDPLPNKHNEKLVAFNYDRLRYWLAKGATPSEPVAELLGLSGFLPIHPRTYLESMRHRKEREAAEKAESTPDAEVEKQE